MNKLWEEFILVCLRRFLNQGNNGWHVNGQEQKSFHGSNTIRPDLVLRNKTSNKTIVLDTKWKLPYNNKASIEDLRQMYTYGRFWQAEKMILLYPGEGPSGAFINYKNDLEFDQIPHQCKVAKVSVLEPSDNWTVDIGRKVFELCEE